MTDYRSPAVRNLAQFMGWNDYSMADVLAMVIAENARRANAGLVVSPFFEAVLPHAHINDPLYLADVIFEGYIDGDLAIFKDQSSCQIVDGVVTVL